jgi:hypothetical protein
MPTVRAVFRAELDRIRNVALASKHLVAASGRRLLHAPAWRRLLRSPRGQRLQAPLVRLVMLGVSQQGDEPRFDERRAGCALRFDRQPPRSDTHPH